MRGRVRRRQASRVASRRADWQTTIALPFGASGVTVVLALPILRRLDHDPELLDRIGHAVTRYAVVNRLPSVGVTVDPERSTLSPRSPQP